MSAHPYVDEQMRAGRDQADAFLRRIVAGEPIEMDGLAQQHELARMGSLARARGFASRIQEMLIAGARDA